MTTRLLIRTTLFLATLHVLALSAFAQQPTPGEDVVRVNTELVQTDFTVVDRDGNFVKGLKKDQLVLKVDGKAREITFFDQIAAGSRNEEAQLAAARGASNSGKGQAVPLDRGRVVMFFVDDVHLSASSLIQVRMLIKRFIEREMRQNDFSSIATVTGRAGFLEQLTDNKVVLNAALQRIGVTSQSTLQTIENPPMGEYQALQIQRRDQDLLNYYVEALLRDYPQLTRDSAESMVASRASGILQNASFYVTRVMSSLKGLIDTTKTIPGRKLLFFISDGFFLDYDRSDNLERLQRVTAAAARSGTVVYSLDARGLSAGLPDASQVVAFDSTGRVSRASMGELTASRDAMASLASDTGGKTIFNTNGLSTAVSNAIKETSVYYLIAWRPENDEQRNPKFRKIEVSIVDRPQVTVRFRRGVGEPIANADPKRAKGTPPQPPPANKTPGDEIRSALKLPLPTSALPVVIALNFVDTPEKGTTLATSVRVATSSLQLEPQAGVPTALLDIAGYVLNDQGRAVSSFSQRLTIRGARPEATQPPDSIFYNDAAFVKPGIYQVRVAARDAKSGAIGSAFQWIEIPNLASRSLAMSSLIVGESRANEQQNNGTTPVAPQNAELRQVSRNVDHRFPRSSYLRFLTFIYNAARSATGAATSPAPATTESSPTGAGSSEPDLAVQIQVFRDDQPVITIPLHKIPTQGLPDLQRIPYAADIRLENLQPGVYMLHVTVIDRLAKSSFSQRLNFEVE